MKLPDKLAALEILDFPADDVRLVAELSTTNGKRDETGHTVVEVRIDGRNWIMNDQHMRAEFIATRSAFFVASYHSVMEPDCVHVNYRNGSLWTPNVKYFPWGSYNSAYFARYEGVTRSDPPVKGDLPQLSPAIEKYISLGTMIGDDAARRQQIIYFIYPVLPPISQAAVDETAHWNAQSFAHVSETDATQKYYPVGGGNPIDRYDSFVSLELSSRAGKLLRSTWQRNAASPRDLQADHAVAQRRRMVGQPGSNWALGFDDPICLSGRTIVFGNSGLADR